MITCRDEVLQAARELAALSSEGAFTVHEVVSLMAQAGTRYKPATIRTHVTSRMCVNAPAHHASRYPDLARDGSADTALTAPRPR